ncbi:MAG: DUF1800 domain-containing protein [Panacagrimonas sp.]
MNPAAILAVHRFGLGPAPGELVRAASDPRGWLVEQLSVQRSPEALKGLPDTGGSLKFLPRVLKNELSKEIEKKPGAKAKAAQQKKIGKSYRGLLQTHVEVESWGRFRAAAESRQPFHERLVRFWSNHFTVSGLKPTVLPLAGAYEREAIRANLSGSFADLLLACTHHPAMLYYLDNDRSVGPNSRMGQRRELGLNENLAREILELHTLGVDGGYTQEDVIAFARTLTGWGVDATAIESGNGGYKFLDAQHEPGPQTVLGRRYPGAGEQQAVNVLRELARHPSTARFIATKLARHFVADAPPASAVERLAKVFRETEGDLPSLHRAVVELPEAWATPGTKFRTPEEFLIGAQRLLSGRGGLTGGEELIAALNNLGQRSFLSPSPAGWPDEMGAWLSGDSLWKRLETISALAARARVDQPLKLAEEAFGDRLAASTRDILKGAESGAQGLALLLAAPEFNRR